MHEWLIIIAMMLVDDTHRALYACNASHLIEFTMQMLSHSMQQISNMHSQSGWKTHDDKDEDEEEKHTHTR